MKNIEINIGNVCNNECKFCMVEFEGISSFVDYKTISLEIINSRNQGYQLIGFLGGEFTLHPDIFKIIKLCKISGFKIIHIISNGRRYNDREFLYKLIKNGANRFSVSVHSHLDTVEDYLTQRKGGWLEKYNGLKNLLDFYNQGLIKNKISINFVINKKNYKDIIKTLEFFNNLGIGDFRLNYIWLHGRAQNHADDLHLKYCDFLPYVDLIIELAEKKGLNISFEGIPPCLIKNKEKNNYLGELKDYNTNIIAFNNRRNDREAFNWQKRKADKFKIKHEKCKDCQWNNVCDGVWLDYINRCGWQEFNF